MNCESMIRNACHQIICDIVRAKKAEKKQWGLVNVICTNICLRITFRQIWTDLFLFVFCFLFVCLFLITRLLKYLSIVYMYAHERNVILMFLHICRNYEVALLNRAYNICLWYCHVYLCLLYWVMLIEFITSADISI